MSLINGNLFQDTDFYMIGRDILGRYYSFARLHDGDKLRQRDIWISDSPSLPSQPEITKFYKFRTNSSQKTAASVISCYLDDDSAEEVQTFPEMFFNTENEKSVDHDSFVFLGDRQVPEKAEKIDSGFYFGVWYDAHLIVAGKPSYKLKSRTCALPAGSANVKGFGGFIDVYDGTSVDYSKSLQITFVPYSTTSVYHEGRCRLLTEAQPMDYFTRWVTGEIVSEGCDRLNCKSQNCIFSDSKCNNNVGFRLATYNETCGGRVYGPCETGTCAYNGRKFVCVDPSELVVENPRYQDDSNTVSPYVWLFLGILALFAFLAFYVMSVYVYSAQ